MIALPLASMACGSSTGWGTERDVTILALSGGDLPPSPQAQFVERYETTLDDDMRWQPKHSRQDPWDEEDSLAASMTYWTKRADGAGIGTLLGVETVELINGWRVEHLTVEMEDALFGIVHGVPHLTIRSISTEDESDRWETELGIRQVWALLRCSSGSSVHYQVIVAAPADTIIGRRAWTRPMERSESVPGEALGRRAGRCVDPDELPNSYDLIWGHGP